MKKHAPPKKYTWMHDALDALRNGVVVTDPNLPDNPIIFVNKTFEKMTGFLASEVLGRNCRFLQGENKNQENLNILREAISKKKSCSVILENHKKDGSHYLNQLDITPIYDDKGEVTHFLGLQHDITEKINNNLQIEKQKEMVLAASKMALIGEMTGSICHEINNPLMVLRSHINNIYDSLKDHQNLSEETIDSLSKMDETIDHVSRIVKSLQEFSRQSDPKKITCESVENLVQETLLFCQDRINSKNIVIETNIQESSKVLMRKIEIIQILINLINNSIDEIAQQDDRRIIIESKLSEHHCYITVSDYGRGIPVENKELIFAPFFTTKMNQGGTGLGLAISKKMITSHGGTIELTSPENPTSFTLKLRLQAD